jgi:SAM (Sterile alpha motif) domain-containing protein
VKLIAEWLDDIGLSEYCQRVADHDIDVSVLPHLTIRDLKEIGGLLGHQRKMLAPISRLTGASTSPLPNAPSEPQPREIAERRQVTLLFANMVGSTALYHSNSLSEAADAVGPR